MIFNDDNRKTYKLMETTNVSQEEFIANKLSNSDAYKSYVASTKAFKNKIKNTVAEIENFISKSEEHGFFRYETQVISRKHVIEVANIFIEKGYIVSYTLLDSSDESFLLVIDWDFDNIVNENVNV